MQKFGDPGFRYHAAVGQYISLLLYTLANEDIVPLDVANFAETVSTRYLNDLISKVNSRPNMEALQLQLNISGLIDSIHLFEDRAKSIKAIQAQSVSLKNATLVASINQKYRDFQRAFVSQGALPGRGEFFKHVIYAPGLDTGRGILIII